MLQVFIITLREGVEAALIVGITLVYLAKIGRQELRKSVYYALGAAFVASLGLAFVVARLNWNTDVFEGWIMLAAAFFVITMIIFMMRTAKHLKGEIEGKVANLARESSRLGLFVFVFLLVLREGVETVLVLSAVSLNSTELMKFLATLAGVGMSIAFGVMFVKGSVRIDLRKFFKITTVILWFVAAQLIVAGLHELSENGVIPSSKREMAIVGPIARNEMFFFVTILALAALMVLFEYRRRRPMEEPVTNADKRKAKWLARRERMWMISVYASSLIFIVLVTAEFIYAKAQSAPSQAVPVAITNGKIEIPVAQVSDGDIHQYVATTGGVDVRFWLFKKPDGNLAVVFDACEICGPVGFFKDARGVVCRNCAAPINAQSVGVAGGCNPIPLKANVGSATVVIEEADLATHAAMFKK